MRVTHKQKKTGDNPYTLFKKGVARQYFPKPVTKRPHKLPNGHVQQPKRPLTDMKIPNHLKYKVKKEKPFKKTNCGCGCKGE